MIARLIASPVGKWLLVAGVFLLFVANQRHNAAAAARQQAERACQRATAQRAADEEKRQDAVAQKTLEAALRSAATTKRELDRLAVAAKQVAETAGVCTLDAATVERLRAIR